MWKIGPALSPSVNRSDCGGGGVVAVSPATLKRQLSAAGTTYSKLLDRIRFDAACEMLSIPQMTVKEISHELGYSGTNNFVRSFRRMTGMTPGQYRQQQNT